MVFQVVFTKMNFQNLSNIKLRKYYHFKQFLQVPAKTCADLHAAFPDSGSGHYYIDPNEGHSSDALLAFCNMDTLETCIYPTPMEVKMIL